MRKAHGRVNRNSAAVAVLLVIGLAVLVSSASALRMTPPPEDYGVGDEPVARKLRFKLPLEQPTFHWEFMSREAFLAGKLVLRITRAEKTDEIVVFNNGKFSEGWAAMEVGDVERERGEIYFGFESKTKHPTAPGDKLEIELTVKTDLDGIGALHTGILPAGKYVSAGSHSMLVDVFDTTVMADAMRGETGELTDEQVASLQKMHEMYDYTAFLESWDTQWPLTITGGKGWLPEDMGAEARRRREDLKAREVRGRKD
ncbi:MAG: hypothetical protein ACYTAN_13600 [Planctomycetota bacterium]|jgi:hypothetical protein